MGLNRKDTENKSNQGSQLTAIFGDPENAFKNQTVTFYNYDGVSYIPAGLTDGDEVILTYNGESSGSLIWPFTAEAALASINEISTSSALINDFSASGFKVYFSSLPVVGLLEVSVTGSGDGDANNAVTTLVSKTITPNQFSVNMFTFENGTNQAMDILYQASQDNIVWMNLLRVNVPASTIPGVAEAHGQGRDAITEPWKYLRVSVTPTAAINIDENEVLLAYWSGRR